MAEETQEINWCAVIQGCVYERTDGIGDYFYWLDLNSDLVNARGWRQEQAAFTEKDLEQIRNTSFNNKLNIPLDSEGDFYMLPNAILTLMLQLRQGLNEPIAVDSDCDDSGYCIIRLEVFQEIGQKVYRVEIDRQRIRCSWIKTWGDFLDVAYKIAQLFLAALDQWKRDAQYITEAGSAPNATVSGA